MENENQYWSQDVTFCMADCGNLGCYRNSKHIDWSTVEHQKWGVSMALFQSDCKNYMKMDEKQ